MTYKLNQTVYIVDHHSNYLKSGKITNIKTTIYGDSIEINIFIEYCVGSRWYHDDICFSSKEAANKYLLCKLKNRLDDLVQRISAVNDEIS